MNICFLVTEILFCREIIMKKNATREYLSTLIIYLEGSLRTAREVMDQVNREDTPKEKLAAEKKEDKERTGRQRIAERLKRIEKAQGLRKAQL